MAAKTAKATKTGNPERRSGKAWGKDHNATVKVLTPEQQDRKAHKDAERERRKPGSHERGSSLTMPKITWEWCGSMMAARWPNTRKVRSVNAYFDQGRSSWQDDQPAVIETNPEIKPKRPPTNYQKNGR